MTRALGIGLAVLFGAASLLLLAGPVSASYAGRTTSCTTVVNVAAVDAPAPTTRRERLASAACHDALVRRTELTGLAALGCIAAASPVLLGRRGQPGYGTSVCQPLSS